MLVANDDGPIFRKRWHLCLHHGNFHTNWTKIIYLASNGNAFSDAQYIAICNGIRWHLANLQFLLVGHHYRNICKNFQLNKSLNYALCSYRSKCAFLQSNNIFESLKCFEWYLLPKVELKPYQILLHRAQLPEIILIGGIRELNMQTCAAVSRVAAYRIYLFNSFIFSTYYWWVFIF